MIAAIYARKSTDQNGVSEAEKSVTRQIDHARAYAEGKGWTVDDRYIFTDDGICGAEFANRPGFLRLMNSLKPRPSSPCSSCPRSRDSAVKASRPPTPSSSWSYTRWPANGPAIKSDDECDSDFKPVDVNFPSRYAGGWRHPEVAGSDLAAKVRVSGTNHRLNRRSVRNRASWAYLGTQTTCTDNSTHRRLPGRPTAAPAPSRARI